jgi:hypothetical protein
MSCRLENHIEHTNVKDNRFTETCNQCTLFAEKGAMSSLGQCCLLCCLRINQILEERSRPLFVEPGTPNDALQSQIMLHKRNLKERLPENLKEYYDEVAKVSKKDWDTIAQECSRCPINYDSTSGMNESLHAKEATPMSHIGMNE